VRPMRAWYVRNVRRESSPETGRQGRGRGVISGTTDHFGPPTHFGYRTSSDVHRGQWDPNACPHSSESGRKYSSPGETPTVSNGTARSIPTTQNYGTADLDGDLNQGRGGKSARPAYPTIPPSHFLLIPPLPGATSTTRSGPVSTASPTKRAGPDQVHADGCKEMNNRKYHPDMLSRQGPTTAGIRSDPLGPYTQPGQEWGKEVAQRQTGPWCRARSWTMTGRTGANGGQLGMGNPMIPSRTSSAMWKAKNLSSRPVF